jgi:predicted PurR-regulated permease PerM
VWELVRTLDDDERAASAFLGLGALGLATWFATAASVQPLLPAATIASLLAVVFGIVGWRAARNGEPREASTFVAIVLAFALAGCWVVSAVALASRLA